MTEMFGEAWSPMSVPDLAPDDDDDDVKTLDVFGSVGLPSQAFNSRKAVSIDNKILSRFVQG